MRRVACLFALLFVGVGIARSQTTWTVCASGCDFTAIQPAVGTAIPGDTVQVLSGTFAGAVHVDKTLELVGAGPDDTTISVTAPSPWGFSLDAASITVSGFRFLGPGSTGDGLRLGFSAGCEITGNRFEDLATGINLDSADGNQVLGNEFLANGTGVKLDGADSNTVDGNTFLDNTQAIVLIGGSADNTLSGNDVGGGTRAVTLQSAGSGNQIRDNVMTGGLTAILLNAGSGNTVANNLMESLDIAHVFTTDSNTWNDPKSAGTNIVGGPFVGGNAYLEASYFAYNCPDADTDRICDAPYSHDPPADQNVDLLPLRMVLGPEDELDWGDAPFPYPTTYANQGAGHFLVPGGSYLGAAVDVDPDGVPTATALGDDQDLDGDDEDGATFLGPLVRGALSRVEVVVAAPGLLSAWIDFDGDGVWEGGPESIFGIGFVPSGLNVVDFLVPTGAILGASYGRFRICAACVLGSEGIAPDGEVEDYLVTIHDAMLDCGDAPDPPYPTYVNGGGACHLFGGGLYLGPGVDWESTGSASPDAEGDDNAGIDDEEGLVLVSDLVAGYTSELDLTSSGPGVFQVWIDLDRNGDWSGPGEMLVDSHVAAGLNTVSFAVPASASAGVTFARVRLSSAGGLSHRWVAADGEVQDHKGEIFGSLPLDLTIQNEAIDQRRIFRALETITILDSEVMAPVTLCASTSIAIGDSFEIESSVDLVVRLDDPSNC